MYVFRKTIQKQTTMQNRQGQPIDYDSLEKMLSVNCHTYF